MGRQHVRLVYAAMLANFTALAAYERRTGRPPGDPLLLAAAWLVRSDSAQSELRRA
jgi:hypothetical protein